MKTRLNWLSPPVFLAAAALVIGHSLRISNGIYDSGALVWLTAGIALAWLGVLVRQSSSNTLAILVCVGGLLWQIQQDMTDVPMVDCSNPYIWLYYTSVAIPAFTAAALGAILLSRFARIVFIPLLLATYFITGFVMLRESKPPFIDVYEISRDACLAISRGVSPYAIDLSAGRRELGDYPAGSVVNGRVQYGYPYTPLDLAVEYPAHVLTGDFRVGILLAETIAAGLLAYSAPGPLPAAAAAILLLTPKGYFCVQQAWVD